MELAEEPAPLLSLSLPCQDTAGRLQARKHVLTKGPSPPAPWSWATGLQNKPHYLSHPSWYFAMAPGLIQVSISTYTDIERAPKCIAKLFKSWENVCVIQCKCKKENCWSNPYISAALPTLHNSDVRASSHLIEKLSAATRIKGRKKSQLVFCSVTTVISYSSTFWRPHLGFLAWWQLQAINYASGAEAKS